MSRCAFEKRRPEIVRNLLRVYRSATPAEITAGVEWYPAAQAIVREWASHYRFSVDTVACVTAALSPQLEWKRNLIIADDTLAERMPSINGVLHANLRKAERLRDTDYRSESETIAERMLAEFPGGPKVQSFARNLAGDMSAVTVDTHAAQAGLYDPLAVIRLPRTPYTIFAECYERAALRAGRTPAEFQAIVWVTWKRLFPTTWKQQNRREWFAVSELED